VDPPAKSEPPLAGADAEAPIAGLFSTKGASRPLLVFAEFGLVRVAVPAAAVDEVRRNVAQQLSAAPMARTGSGTSVGGPAARRGRAGGDGPGSGPAFFRLTADHGVAKSPAPVVDGRATAARDDDVVFPLLVTSTAAHSLEVRLSDRRRSGARPARP
jgi:hypothetical protein